MKVGLIARADSRGLGLQSLEWYRHVQPDRTLVVREPNAEARGFAAHLDWYPGETVLTFDGALDGQTVRPWLRGLDVVYCAETVYDWRLIEWAREARVRTIVHVNPEFYRHGRDPLPSPDVWWAPTCWRLNTLPERTRIVPVPVPTDRWPDATVRDDPRVLHIIGHRAAADRAGTTQFLQALRACRQPQHVILATQDEFAPVPVRLPSHVQVELRAGGIENYWDLYDEGGVLAFPRRYGGLSLVANEACGAGLALVLPDTEPHRQWPGLFVPAREHGFVNAPAGTIPCYDPTVAGLAQALDRMSALVVRRELSSASLAWADAHSWDVLLPTIRDELDRACA